MPRTLVFPAPPASLSEVPGLAVLARIVEETDLDDGVRVAGELVAAPHSGRLVTSALTETLHARYFQGGLSAPKVPGVGRRGAVFCRRVTEALQPEFFRGDDWRFAYRTTAGMPSFVVATGSSATDATSCFLHLRPGTAPEVFARVVTALDGYGVAFRAELAGDPDACVRADAAVVTVDRGDASTLARVALRVQQRAPFALAPSAPAFTRQLAPGIALADEPGHGHGTTFGRHRCRLVATGLVAAGHGAGLSARRAAVLKAFEHAGLDPAALHLNPGNREIDVSR